MMWMWQKKPFPQLEQEIALAQAFKSLDPEQWQKVSRRAAHELLTGLVLWCRTDGSHNPLLPPPPKPLASRVYLYSWEKARLYEVLMRALTGLSTEKERKALASGR